jgi:hypothetical protein
MKALVLANNFLLCAFVLLHLSVYVLSLICYVRFVYVIIVIIVMFMCVTISYLLACWRAGLHDSWLSSLLAPTTNNKIKKEKKTKRKKAGNPLNFFMTLLLHRSRAVAQVQSPALRYKTCSLQTHG